MTTDAAARVLAAYLRGDAGLDFGERSRCRQLAHAVERAAPSSLARATADPAGGTELVRHALDRAAAADPAVRDQVAQLAPEPAGAPERRPIRQHATVGAGGTIVQVGGDFHGVVNGGGPGRETRKKAILFMASDPVDLDPLRLGLEAREIEEALRLGSRRDEFALQPRTAVRPRDLTRALLELHPRIVHFSGHGSRTGALCFEDASGESRPVSAQALAAVFAALDDKAEEGDKVDKVECVVMNACFSAVQAEAISRHVPFVVGMTRAVSDEAAIAFSLGFYQAIGEGCGVPKAFELGRAQVMISGIAEHLTPRLLVRGA